MKISRQVGTQSQILNVYAQDFSVTTGAGIANIPASTVSYSWFRNNHAGVSTGVGVSTASMGTYTSGAWTQVNSATALGWYQFCIPNDALLSGDCSALLLRVSTGAFNMAPIPIEIELTKTNNQQYTSSQTIQANVIQAYGSAIVTSAAGQLQVSTQAIDKGGYGVTSIATAVTTTANIVQIRGSAAVTSNAGILTVSTQAIDKGGYGVTSISASVTTTANVVQIYGSAAVTSASGQLTVSTQAIDKGGYGVTTVSLYGTAIETSAAGQVRAGIDWANVTNKAAYNDLSSTFISTNQSIAGASAPTAAQVAQAVWDEIATSHTASSSFAQVLKLGMSNVSTLITGVNVTSFMGTSSPARPGYVGIDWAFVTSKAAYNDLSSTFISTNQSIAGASAPTAAQVAVAVWDEVTTSHTVSSTFGLILRTMSAASSTWVTTSDVASSSQIIQGIWNEINSSYSGVSTFGYLLRQVTSVSAGVNVTAFSGAITTNARIVQVYGSAVVTSAAGQLLVSTQAIDKGGYGVTTIASNITTNANLLQVYGSAVVTSAAGTLTVSTQTLAGMSGSVNVSSIMGSPAVTTAAGVLLVSTQAIPAFATSSDSRLALLDASVSSRAVAGDAMALTAGERATLAGTILTTTMAESYRSVNATGSLMQLGYEILANLTEQTASGTTRTLASVTSHAGNVAQYQYDSSSQPASIKRIS